MAKKKTAPNAKGTEVARAAKAVVGVAAAAAGTLGKIVATAFSIPGLERRKRSFLKRRERRKAGEASFKARPIVNEILVANGLDKDTRKQNLS